MPAVATACAPPPYDVHRNIPYDSTLDIYGQLDFYEPLADSARERRPAILAIHGGAWMTGDKAWGGAVAKELVPYGYVVFSINYRLSDEPNGDWPAQIEDVQKALRFIRANASRFRIDPTRIASLGMSAGGHLATMVALRYDPVGADGRVSVAVNLDGEHDMTMPPDQVMADFENILTNAMGHGPPWSDAELKDISTLTFVRPDVSVLTIHGVGDDNVYFPQGERITSALLAVGAKAEFVRVDGKEGSCHSECWRAPVALDAIHRFLDRELGHDGAAFFRSLGAPR
jgi:acetyl esterase/lipase